MPSNTNNIQQQIRNEIFDLMENTFNVDLNSIKGEGVVIQSPLMGNLFTIKADTAQSYKRKVARAQDAFESWRQLPAPKRGEFMRILGDEFRKSKIELGRLVTLEAGKITTEGLGEVQEIIDICDYATGLSRTYGGHTFPSERPEHTLVENWEPLGPIGIISAFNFPVAVWAWNFAIGGVVGDTSVWKPHEKTTLTALACQAIVERARIKAKAAGIDVPEISQVVLGGREIGEAMSKDKNLPLISATGSTIMGKKVAVNVAERLGKSILELGGNNAAVIEPDANLGVALQSVIFGAVGTAGQRCTTTRRLFIHEDVYDKAMAAIKEAYQSIIENKIGDPRKAETLVGPLFSPESLDKMQSALRQAEKDGGIIYYGKQVHLSEIPGATFAQPAIVEMKQQAAIVREETFAPILYVMKYKNLNEAIDAINEAPQGLSNSIFTSNLIKAEQFKQNVVSGIVNVNAGTSGAEIGGAFGGEKDTGGGRESGSDSWKQYARRVTTTTYNGTKVPTLSQGVKFEIK